MRSPAPDAASLPQTFARNKQITGQSHVFPPFPVRNGNRAAARSIAGACATLGMIIKVVGLRGWIMVKAPALTKTDILENIRSGNFYATTGVILNDYRVTEKYITIDSQNGESIVFTGKNGSVLKTVKGNKAEYQIKGDEYYIRAKITNSSGKMAWTQPIFIQK